MADPRLAKSELLVGTLPAAVSALAAADDAVGRVDVVLRHTPPVSPGGFRALHAFRVARGGDGAEKFVNDSGLEVEL